MSAASRTASPPRGRVRRPRDRTMRLVAGDRGRVAADHLKTIASLPFEGYGQVIYPFFFVMVAFFASEPATTRAASPTPPSGPPSWACVRRRARLPAQRCSASAGTGRSSSRRNACAIRPLLLPVTLAMSSIGIYSLARHPLYGPPPVRDRPRDRPSAPVRDRDPRHGPLLRRARLRASPSRSSASARRGRSGTCSQYPFWLIGGFLVPLVLLPHWVRPISWVLAPTWGMNAFREAAARRRPLDDLAACLGLERSTSGSASSSLSGSCARRARTRRSQPS